MKKKLLVFLFVINCFSFAQNVQEITSLTGDYLGQTPPGDTPMVFARGIVSDNYQQHGVPAFSPDGDEVYWQTNKLDSSNNWLISVMTMKLAKSKWTIPEISPYSSGPVFSPDGKRLYVGSNGEGADPYFMKKQRNGWSEPESLSLVSRFPELKFAYNLSITRNGTLYFLGYAPANLGLWNNYAIYRTELINGEYAKPELLPPSINASGGILNWTPFIDPDESYLLFCSRRVTPKDDYGDLFVCFRKSDGSWTDRISLGDPINTNGQERFPSVSPDGKYLFFTRWTPDYDEDVFWVSAKIIDSIKATLTDVKEDGIGINKSFKLNQNYPNPFNPSTTIKYKIPSVGTRHVVSVQLKIYDTLGREIKTLVDSFQNTGEHSVVLNGIDDIDNPVSSGVYFYSLATNKISIQKKMVIIR